LESDPLHSKIEYRKEKKVWWQVGCKIAGKTPRVTNGPTEIVSFMVSNVSSFVYKKMTIIRRRRRRRRRSPRPFAVGCSCMLIYIQT
jgi:hypothetical protein